MPAIKSKFRTNLQEYSELIEQIDDGAAPDNNGKFIAIIAIGVLVAITLGTLLSIKF
jgi:hypothetical protein